MQPQLLHAQDIASPRAGRLRAVWRAVHEPVAGVSRRMRLVAYAVLLAVLPSSLWRLPAALDNGISVGERIYIVILSVLSEVLAFTAFGLITRWGEVFPRWVPFLRDRRIPTMAAVIPAATGATLITFVCFLNLIAEIMGKTIRGDELSDDAPSDPLFYVCYAPLLLWGPLLAVLTVAYWRRRRAIEHAPAKA